MIVDGIKVARIRVPKILRHWAVWDWVGVLDPTTKNGKLVRKLALSAAKRWALAPKHAGERVMSGDIVRFEATREAALRALQLLETDYPVGVAPGLTIDELTGWAQVEIDFQQRIADPEVRHVD